ncbi:hypothetical protein A2246_05455 [candidate division WOR-1 bacterium RIFOXYA2_FULL_37_7]|uniref:Histidine kinase/HSP90-like ATPase domain-containing protein n=1 Tax=candidate division WOR-1 bacterium RIFOXYB2_FULL_37_13 TaxID=1802579 RepID=A0A1F4SSV9_UNCSA|nr:MAG: hypothetical protein A2246_05455 [candidate division WOR-1 bacterium RIFOXYA2_FULL_37_7]OGC23516.1 MAG: hypothetical protein A2310_02820 [candidate division WOR-1 bacterium RIFOXYB2_FULL_37_13]
MTSIGAKMKEVVSSFHSFGRKESNVTAFSPIFGRIIPFAMDCASRSPEFCASLFKPNNLQKELLRTKDMRVVDWESFLRQGAKPEQFAKELIVNGLEAVRGIKIVGMYGMGRLMSLRYVKGVLNAFLEVTTKITSDMGRVIRFFSMEEEGIKDVSVELREANDDMVEFSHGTRVELRSSLIININDKILEGIRNAFRFVMDANVPVNSDRANKPEKWKSLRHGEINREIKGNVEVLVYGDTFCVKDDGPGMGAERAVKGYLGVAKSEGSLQREYRDDIQEADIYYAKDFSEIDANTSRKSRVSFLMCGVEIIGIEVEGVNVEGNLGVELGTGIRPPQSKDKIKLGAEEVKRINGLIKEVLKIEGYRKWSILNSLVAALESNELLFEAGEREALLKFACVEAKEVPHNESRGEALFLPNEKGFIELKASGKKVYVKSELLAEFKVKDAGIITCDSRLYESKRGYTIHWAQFDSDEVWVEVGKNVIINRRYENNKLMLNLRAGFYIGYGEREEPKFKLLWPWEIKAKEKTRESAQKSDTKGLAPASAHEKTKAKRVKSFLAGLKGSDRMAAVAYFAISGRTLESVEALTSAIARRDEFHKRFGERIGLKEILYRTRSLNDLKAVDSYFISLGGRQFLQIKDCYNRHSLYEIVGRQVELVAEFKNEAELAINEFDPYLFNSGGSDLFLFVVSCYNLPNGKRHQKVFLKDKTGYRQLPADFDEIIGVEFYDGKIILAEVDDKYNTKKIRLWEIAQHEESQLQPALHLEGSYKFNFCNGSSLLYDRTKHRFYEKKVGEKEKPINALISKKISNVLQVHKGEDGFLIIRNDEPSIFIRNDGQAENTPEIGLNGVFDSVSFVDECGNFWLNDYKQKSFWVKRGGRAFEPTTQEKFASVELRQKASSKTYFNYIMDDSEDVDVYYLKEGTYPVISRCGKQQHPNHYDLDILLEKRLSLGRIPSSLPTQQPWFSSSEERLAYEARRHEMICRLAAGDYSEEVKKVELFGYLNRQAVQRLGSELIAQIEKKFETKIGGTFRYQEAYLSFIEKLWDASEGEIDADRFRRIVSRWNSFVGILEADLDELERLLSYFDKTRLYSYLHDGEMLPDDPEIKGFVHIFTLENIRESQMADSFAMAKLMPTRKITFRIDDPYDLAFHYWAGLYNPGWSKNRRQHLELLEKYKGGVYRGEPIEHKTFRDYVRGEVKGQDLKGDICGREFIQNAIDAGAKHMDITTYSKKREDGYIYHFAAYRDDGKGLSSSGVKELLLNLGVSDKKSEAADAKKNIGKNGIGFESSLNDNDLVMVRTSNGDGTFTEVELVGNNLDARVLRYVEGLTDKSMRGLEVHVGKKIGKEEEEEQNKIKTIFREMILGFRLKDMAGLVDPSVLSVSYRGAPIAERILDRESVVLEGKGRYSLLKVGKEREARVVQNGLIVNHSKEKYLRYFPEFLKKYVEDCAFEIGEDEELTRGRDDVMEDERVVAGIFIQLAMRKAIKEYLQTGEEFGNLPKDYLYSQHLELGNGNLEGYIPEGIEEDKERINIGNICDVGLTKYLGREDDLTMLMTLVKLKDGEGNAIYLQAIRDAIADVSKGGKEIPRFFSSPIISAFFREKIESAVKKRIDYLAAHRSEGKRKAVADLPEQLRLFADTMLDIYTAMGLTDPEVDFYSNPDEVRIATYGLNHFRFRIEAIEERARKLKRGLELKKQGQLAKIAINGEKLNDRNIVSSVAEAIDVFSYLIEEPGIHEGVHDVFGSSEGWSHGSRFKERAIGFVDVMLKNGYNPLLPRDMLQ